MEILFSNIYLDSLTVALQSFQDWITYKFKYFTLFILDKILANYSRYQILHEHVYQIYFKITRRILEIHDFHEFHCTVSEFRDNPKDFCVVFNNLLVIEVFIYLLLH